MKSVKGHHACLICEKKTCYIQMKHGKKTVYTRHQRFLKPYHPYRQLKKTFNGENEIESVPKPLAGHEVYDRVKDIVTIFGKTQKGMRMRRTFERKGQYSLIFLTSAIYMYDIIWTLCMTRKMCVIV